MGKGSGGSSSSSGGSEAVSYAPVQLGAKTSASSFRPEWFETALNGLYDMVKNQVVEGYNTYSGSLAKDATSRQKYNHQMLENLEEKAISIADQMMVSFAQNVKPDQVMKFPLDDFVKSTIEKVYNQAESIYQNPTLNRAELKTMIDSNLGNLTTQFAQQRRGIEQEIASRGLTGAAAAEARDRAETEIARSKESVARDTLASEFSQKKTRQLQALGIKQNATSMAQAQTSQLSQRWLDQWKTKLSAEQLRQSGIQASLGAVQTAAGIEQQEIANDWNLINYPNQLLSYGQNFLSNINQQAIEEYGKHVSAYGGAGSSSSWNTSEGNTPGSYNSPLNLWGGWST